jgi:cell fate regulator YaaT (PSP1 superfamily)
MINVIGVRFRRAGKVHFYMPGRNPLKRDDLVIAETVKGVEMGLVVMPPTNLDDERIPAPIKGIIRIATDRDKKEEAENRVREREAYDICVEKIEKHQLEMKLIEAEYTFDRNKLLFYFTADGRIDFRELVKDLASVFRTRIELRQIGVRDETKILGGMGICGRVLCCNTFLNEFVPVSIKMAKEQNLSLNPTKISGVCGRLMCCLKNEEEAYEYLNQKLPNIGSQVKTSEGLVGEVVSIAVLKQRIKVIVNLDNDEKEVREYGVQELTFKRERKRDNTQIDKELKVLEHLEKEEGKSRLDVN